MVNEDGIECFLNCGEKFIPDTLQDMLPPLIFNKIKCSELHFNTERDKCLEKVSFSDNKNYLALWNSILYVQLLM